MIQDPRLDRFHQSDKDELRGAVDRQPFEDRQKSIEEQDKKHNSAGDPDHAKLGERPDELLKPNSN